MCSEGVRLRTGYMPADDVIPYNVIESERLSNQWGVGSDERRTRELPICCAAGDK